jgi:hypothetical protein
VVEVVAEADAPGGVTANDLGVHVPHPGSTATPSALTAAATRRSTIVRTVLLDGGWVVNSVRVASLCRRTWAT